MSVKDPANTSPSLHILKYCGKVKIDDLRKDIEVVQRSTGILFYSFFDIFNVLPSLGIQTFIEMVEQYVYLHSNKFTVQMDKDLPKCESIKKENKTMMGNDLTESNWSGRWKIETKLTRKKTREHTILFWMLVKRMTPSWQRQKSSELVRREYKCIFCCGFGIIIAPQTKIRKKNSYSIQIQQIRMHAI